MHTIVLFFAAEKCEWNHCCPLRSTVAGPAKGVIDRRPALA
jgi:hypothetical protein